MAAIAIALQFHEFKKLDTADENHRFIKLFSSVFVCYLVIFHLIVLIPLDSSLLIGTCHAKCHKESKVFIVFSYFISQLCGMLS